MDTPPDLATLAPRLEWLRRQAALTQAELGTLCGVTKGYICRLESGQRQNPRSEFLAACSAALTIPEPWLRHATGDLPTVVLAPRPTGPASPAVPSSVISPPSSAPSDLATFFKILLQLAPVSADTWLRLTARIIADPDISQGFKERAVIAATLAWPERPPPPPEPSGAAT